MPVLSCVSSNPCDIGLSAPSPFNTTLLSQGRAPFAEMFTLLRPNEPAFATSEDTPGDSARICVKLRLESGTPLSLLLTTSSLGCAVESKMLNGVPLSSRNFTQILALSTAEPSDEVVSCNWG